MPTMEAILDRQFGYIGASVRVESWVAPPPWRRDESSEPAPNLDIRRDRQDLRRDYRDLNHDINRRY